MNLSFNNIIIYAPDIHQGDAVGNHCLGVYDAAETLGLNATLCALRSSFEKDKYNRIDVEDLLRCDWSESLLFISYSIYDEKLEELIDLGVRTICYFHNVTSPELLEKYEPITAKLCEKSYSQLTQLKSIKTVISNSKFTQDVLFKYGVESKVIPPIFPQFLDKFEINIGKKFKENSRSLIFIGRVVPHKNIEMLFYIIYLLRKSDYKYKLNIVGNISNLSYFHVLQDRIEQLNIKDSVKFYGSVSSEVLEEMISSSSAMITASRHEGFCIPLIEALSSGVPAFALKGTAADELLSEKTLFSSIDDGKDKILNLLEIDRDNITLVLDDGSQKVSDVKKQCDITKWLDIFLDIR